MEIKFKKLRVRNFKGMKDMTIEFQPDVTRIMGANHTGKTTTADAISWVLFGKSSQGLTSFGIDPRDDDNNIIHHLDNSVELTMDVDGRETTLAKTRKETWGKPRGQEGEVLTGHTVDCFVNGENLTATDYKATVNGICKESLFKAVTSPEYFPRLNADDQRTLLVRMVGARSLADIANGNDGFMTLLGKVNGDNEEAIEAYRKHLAYSMKETRKELAAIPPRISENADILNTIKSAGTNYDFTRKRIEEIDKGIKGYDKQLADATTAINADYDRRAAKRKEINDCRREMTRIELSYADANAKAKNDQKAEVRKLEADLNALRLDLSEAQAKAERYRKTLDDIAIRKEDFRKRWQEVEAMEFAMGDNESICPTCGQRLPDDMIEHKREQLEKNFNLAKAAKQDKLDIEASLIKEEQGRTEALLEACKRDIETKKQQVEVAQERLEGAKGMKVEQRDYRKDNDWLVNSEKIDRLQAELDGMGTVADDSKAIIEKKRQLMATRDGLMATLATEKELQERERRIEELKKQQRDLNQQLTDMEREDSQAEAFEHAVIADLEQRVNELFPTVRFKMFETLINGNVRPTCQLTMHGVPYPDLSNSEKILAGLECVRAMQRHANVHAPVIIDNCESVNRFPDGLDFQLILLYVSTDRQLTIIK